MKYLVLIMILFSFIKTKSSYVGTSSIRYRNDHIGKIDAKPFKAENYFLLNVSKVEDKEKFYWDIYNLSQFIGVSYEDLMTVMYKESGINPNIRGFTNNSAVGLIQLTPIALKELKKNYGISNDISNLDYQIHVIGIYFKHSIKCFGKFRGLTDLYLSIICPVARKHIDNKDYVLYKYPYIAYRQNKGLDHDKDGRITVGDIEAHLKYIVKNI